MTNEHNHAKMMISTTTKWKKLKKEDQVPRKVILEKIIKWYDKNMENQNGAGVNLGYIMNDHYISEEITVWATFFL
ncbi:hypothetical protein WD019_20695 [Fictibacillus sp. Mic-4]|uniref:hypothetical protein n=1 Tax=Fictibacillus sp. Mic-4 TaxID=3132826 RepID=UPI003CF44219